MPQEPLSAEKRIREILKTFNLTIKGLSEELKFPSPQIIYDITYGRTKTISTKVADAIRQRYNYISYPWLLSGEGEMFLPYDSDEVSPGNLTSSPEPHTEKPADSMARRMQLFNSVLDNWEEVYTCRGDYMEPAIKYGQVLLLSRWEEDFIAWGKIYYLETQKGYQTVAYLHPSTREGHILCRCEDSVKHPDIDIPRESIKNLYIVRAQLTIR